MSIMTILAAILLSVIVGARGVVRAKTASIEMNMFKMGLEKYRDELKQYPADTIPGNNDSGTSATMAGQRAMNEALIYALTRKHKKGLNTYGPYVNLKEGSLQDSDNDGYMEHLDPFGNFYLYAENESQTLQNEKDGVEDPGVGFQPRSYDLVTPGPDHVLGGTISPENGFQGEDSSATKDDVYSWRSKQ